MHPRNVSFVGQEERRASDMVLFTSENNDIANQSVHTSFFTSENNCMTNHLASLARRDYFYLDAFRRVNLGMYIYIYRMYTLKLSKTVPFLAALTFTTGCKPKKTKT